MPNKWVFVALAVLVLVGAVGAYYLFGNPLAVAIWTGFVALLGLFVPKLPDLAVTALHTWIKEKGKILIEISEYKLRWFKIGGQTTSGGYRGPTLTNDADKVSLVELHFTLDVFSHKEVSWAYKLVRVSFRKGEKNIFSLSPYDFEDQNQVFDCVNIPSRDFKRFRLMVHSGEAEQTGIAKADSVYLELTDIRGKWSEHLIGAVSQEKATESVKEAYPGGAPPS